MKSNPMSDDAASPVFPRVPLETLDPRIQRLLQPIAERVGYVGEFFTVVGQNPDALLGFMEYTKSVKTGLSDRLNEVIALTVCARLGADYERVQHERLSQRLGFPRGWIAALVGHPEGQGTELASDEVLLVALCEALLEGPESKQARDLILAARTTIGELPALSAVLQIARFQMIATIVRAFGLVLPVPSVLADSGAAPTAEPACQRAG